MLTAPSKISIDERAFYLKVGFRSASVMKELKEQKTKGKYEKTLVLEEGLPIINRCYEIISGENIRDCELEDLKDFGGYLKLLVENWESLSDAGNCERIISEKKAEIKNAKGLLESIVNEKEVSPEKVDQGINFFEYLTQRCLESLS